jgi:outer membrane protein insertion porin family
MGATASSLRSDLLVKVQEAKPYRLLYGGLYNSKNGVGFIADIENRNSLGNARVLGLRTRYDGEYREFRLYLTQPVLGRRPITTTATTYSTREEVADWVLKDTLGSSIQQDWYVSSKYLVTYGYRYEKFRFEAPEDYTGFVPKFRVTSAPLFFTGSRDTRDSYLDATKGSFISLGNEIAPSWLGSDFGFVRWFGQYSTYFALKKPPPVPYGEEPRRSRLVYATSIRIGLQRGLSDEGIVLTDRFFAGGGTTIRGFEQDSVGPRTPSGKPVGGNAMLVLNNELRFPLVWFFDGVAFSDIGNVYPNVAQFSLTDVRKSAGFGLRIRNPFVVLRFDYGIKLDRRPGESFGAFFFSIGQAF